jgi:hypothetical protein
VGLRYYTHGGDAGLEAAVRVMASRVLAGTLLPMDLAVWAHAAIGHDKLPLAEHLVELDDVYDAVEYADMTEQDVNEEVLAEARRIIGTGGSIDRERDRRATPSGAEVVATADPSPHGGNENC